MSSLIVNGRPARRLLCRASSRPQGVLGAQTTGPILCCALAGRRPYATQRIYPPTPPVRSPRPPSPNSAAAPATTRSSERRGGPAPDEPARLLFSSENVPPLQEWTSNLDSLGTTYVTAEECLAGALRYVQVATQHESRWRRDLEQKHHLSPYVLHWIGLALVASSSANQWRLGTHMLRSASELGFMPSTLTLVRMFHEMPPRMIEKAMKSTMFRDARTRFEKHLADGRDPDAFTMQGMIFARSGDDANAMAMFVRATKAWQETNISDKREQEQGPGDGRSQKPMVTAKDREVVSKPSEAAAARDFTLPPPREPRWEWEISCVLGKAKILGKHSSTAKKAEEMFRVAALELDNSYAFLMLATLMDGPRDSSERRAYLLKAAVSGQVKACQELGELEKLTAARTANAKEKAEHEVFSREWFRIAGSGQ